MLAGGNARGAVSVIDGVTKTGVAITDVFQLLESPGDRFLTHRDVELCNWATELAYPVWNCEACFRSTTNNCMPGTLARHVSPALGQAFSGRQVQAFVSGEAECFSSRNRPQNSSRIAVATFLYLDDQIDPRRSIKTHGLYHPGLHPDACVALQSGRPLNRQSSTHDPSERQTVSTKGKACLSVPVARKNRNTLGSRVL